MDKEEAIKNIKIFGEDIASSIGAYDEIDSLSEEEKREGKKRVIDREVKKIIEVYAGNYSAILTVDEIKKYLIEGINGVRRNMEDPKPPYTYPDDDERI